MEDDVPIPQLQDAIRHMHGCESRFVEAVEVKEEHQGVVVWEGAVKVFDLVGHPKATRAYAWSYPTTGTKRRFVAVLRLPPVDGPAEGWLPVGTEPRGRAWRFAPGAHVSNEDQARF